MTILDRYMLRQFFRVFLMVFVSLLGIFVIADFVGNLADFIDYDAPNGSLGRTLASYYGARVPWFFDIAGRNVAVLASVMTIAWMQKQNELTALLAAGVSRWRVAKPLIFACAIITLLAVINRELGVPRFRNELCRSADDLLQNRPEKITPRYNESDILIDGRAVYQRTRRIKEPRFLLPLDWPGIGRKLAGESAVYARADANRPAGYYFKPRDLNHPPDQLDSLIINGQPLVLTHRDHPDWIPSDELFIVSELGIQQLTRGRQWRQCTATMPLIAGLQSGRFDADTDVRVMVHARFVQPLLDMTLLFLGLPLVLDARHHFIATAAKSLLALTAFAIVVITCHGMGIQGILSPALAAWAPTFLLIPAACILSGSLRQ